MRHVRLHFAAGYPAAAGASTVAVMLHLGMQRVMHTLLEMVLQGNLALVSYLKIHQQIAHFRHVVIISR
jgi:hypothetical protein